MGRNNTQLLSPGERAGGFNRGGREVCNISAARASRLTPPPSPLLEKSLLARNKWGIGDGTMKFPWGLGKLWSATGVIWALRAQSRKTKKKISFRGLSTPDSKKSKPESKTSHNQLFLKYPCHASQNYYGNNLFSISEDVNNHVTAPEINSPNGPICQKLWYRNHTQIPIRITAPINTSKTISVM